MAKPTYEELVELVRRCADQCGDHPNPEDLGEELLQLGADCNTALVQLEA